MSAATFVKYPDSDPAMMDKYGLGGAAMVGDLVFAGGMAIDLVTLKRPEEAVTIADETRICFEGVATTLGLAGCTLADVANVTCYVEEAGWGPEMREAVAAAFAPGPCPRNVTVVAGVGGDCRVEFEVLAVRPGGSLGDLVFADATGADERGCQQEITRKLEQEGCTLKDVVKMKSYVMDDGASVMLDVVAARPGVGA